MPVSSYFFGTALSQLRSLPSVPQCLGVSYLKSTLDKTQLTSHVVFMRQCLRRRLLPHGFRVKFHSSCKHPGLQRSIHRVLHTAGIRLMTQTLRSYEQRVIKLSNHIQHLRRQLRSLLEPPTSFFIIQTVQNANRGLYLKMKESKDHKLSSLLDTTPSSHPIQPSSSPSDTHLVVTIPPDLHLPDEQRQVLSRGLKFVPLKPTTNKAQNLYFCKRFFRRLRLAAHFAKASLPALTPADDNDLAALFPRQPSNWTPKPGVFPALDFYVDQCTNQVTALQPRPLRHSNLSPGEERALQELKERRDIVIKPADKGGAVVVWRRDLYIEEAQSQLSNSSFYDTIPKSTTKSDNADVRKTIKLAIRDNHLPTEAMNAVVKEPRESQFYLLPKIHKPNNPGRPIVSACSCPTALISDFLDSVFQPLVSSLPTFVKDTNHVLNILDNFLFPCAHPDQRHIFTMDIVSLYTNIPHRDGLQAVQHFLRNSTFKLHIPTILRLTELVLTLNSFSFNGAHYQQRRGVAMGTKMGPSFACLFVGFVEEQALHQYTGEKPILYRRFIDDCLGISTCSENSLLQFINFMSSFHPALKYTHCISVTSVSFLDITISISSDSPSVSTSVFYKETDSHSYLLYSSSHPQACKDSIPFSQFLRLKRICSDNQDFEHQAEKMTGFFLDRQYPASLVHRALERARAIPRQEALAPKDRTDNDDRTVAVLTYHPHNLAVRSILLQNFKIIQQDPFLKEIFPKPPLIAFKRDTNLRDHLVRAKVRKAGPSRPGTQPCGQKSCKTCPFVDHSTTIIGPSGRFAVRASSTCQSEDVVYVITCTLCSKMYTGETYRSLNERFSEHLRSMRLGYNDPVGSHFNSPLHNFTHAKVAVVWKNQSTGLYRLFMESSLIARLGTLTPAGLNTRD